MFFLFSADSLLWVCFFFVEAGLLTQTCGLHQVLKRWAADGTCSRLGHGHAVGGIDVPLPKFIRLDFVADVVSTGVFPSIGTRSCGFREYPALPLGMRQTLLQHLVFQP